MTSSEYRGLDRIAVLGAGVLGGQIAWHSAYKGKTVAVYDIDEAALGRCRAAHAHYAGLYPQEVGASTQDIEQAQARLRHTTDLAAAVGDADLVIEAVPEIPEVKTAVYERMAGLLAPHTLIATNSSTLLPRDFAEATGRPDRYCALHFANLIWRMNLAEIMAHPGTATDTLTAITRFAIEIGMVPIPVQKEQNGYVLNTWLVALLNAAQTLVTNGVTTPETVDRTYLITNRGAAVGPMGVIDIIGMKTAFDVLNYWGHQHGDQQMLRNAEYLRTQFIDKGRMGMLSGGGYYDYPDPAYQRPGFLDVPDMSVVPELVSLVSLQK